MSRAAGDWPPLALVALSALVVVSALVAFAFLVQRRLRSRRQLERRVSELETLRRVGRALAGARLDLDALYELIYQQAGEIVDTCTFQLGLFEGGRYHIPIWTRDGERQEAAVFDLGEGEGLVGWVGQHKSPMLVDDFETEWPTLPARPGYSGDVPYRSAVFIPLITGEACIGVMAVQSLTPGYFAQEDVQRLSIVANQAASAIANARLYRQAQTRAAQLELVSRVSRQVRALIPLQDLMAKTVSLIQSTFGYYCVSIYSHDDETGHLVLKASTVDAMTQYYQQLPPGVGLNQWVAARMETALVNDVSTDPRYLPASELPDTRSEMVIPLVLEDQVIGTLDVQSDRQNAFSADDQYALEALADQVALAVHESRLYHAERQQRSVAETLREVAQTLTSTLELEAVLNTILTDLRRVLVYDAAAIFLLDSDDTVVIQAAQGLESATRAQGNRFSLEDSERLRSLARSDRPIIFDCDDPIGRYHSLLELSPEHACLGAPLIAREELIGFLTVDALPPQHYRQEDVAVIAAFAGQAAVAIDNARLFASQREEAWIAAALLQAADAISQFTELDDVLSTIVHMTLTLVGVNGCGILLWEEERSAFRGTQLAGSGTDALLLEDFAGLSLSTDAWPPLAALAGRRQPIVLGGAEALSDLPDELFDYFGLDAWLLLLPLLGKGKLIGAMIVSGEASEVEWIRRRVRLISGIANQAALAIENAQLYTARQADAYVTIALLQVAEAVNSLTELDDILSTIVRLSPMLTGVERCVLLYWHPERGTFSLGPEYGLDGDAYSRLRLSLTESVTGPFLEALSQASDPIGTGTKYPIAMPPTWEGIFDADSVLALPLVTRRELVGALIVSFPAEGVPLNPRRQSILTGIAHQASIAIDNDQLHAEAVERERMERELEVARDIQSSFLPDVHPEESGWSVGALWEAARQVGGDFYDFFRLDPAGDGGQWGLVIADVADKGVPAALYMALSRTLIRTVGLSRRTPAASLERVNDLLLADSRSDLFVTVIYAVWEPGDGLVSYTNAGHNPPLYLRHDGSIDTLQDSNLALGVLPSVSMNGREILMEPGEALIFYTDGITDAVNGAMEEFGLDRLEAVVYASRHLAAPGMVEAIRKAVADFVGQGPQFDDLTLVVVKREPGMSSAG
jgi:sigma-B regulation protein RsbU (phosphoserine phosphatase)